MSRLASYSFFHDSLSFDDVNTLFSIQLKPAHSHRFIFIEALRKIARNEDILMYSTGNSNVIHCYQRERQQDKAKKGDNIWNVGSYGSEWRF